MTGRPVAGAEEGRPVRASDEGVLVWNGMVVHVHRLPCPDASAQATTRPAEASEPIRARPAAASLERRPAR